MAYVIFLGLVGLMMGLTGVASHPSPYFAAFGLVVAAAAGCIVLMGIGESFLSLILFLIYLGGMLVVFAYSAAMSAELYPEAWGSLSVVFYVIVYAGMLVMGWVLLGEDGEVLDGEWLAMIQYDWGGVAMLYSGGGLVLLILGWVLLLTLFIVLELTRGIGFGAMGSK
uniref:NADH-ubiquinone oxidoreductase chain 6 n=1 Tax=Herpele squalostoma TaxID=118254 RepID=K7N8P0_HERSQ|nr:NADH dehydrogenase subunit 6 [Herpele squalostoma]ADR03280.1 NADH dehydrogenase subunit 6 [Herpele squalostoma]